ncbi:MAG: ATP-dependent DNA helicase PcrA [Cyanobacteria bacterium SIG30]|nr:ATP-dependent DNA helicase PcrA [Cyanobacteria bacterium SIG30]
MENTEAVSFLDQLNNKQREAVDEKNGAILVLAGAGSGKTKVLTSRIVNLILNGVSPYSIMALTFTNKAAREMQVRLSKFLGEDVVKRMWVGTFHNICGRILRKHLEKYKTKDGRKWDNNYVIYDDTDTKTVLKNIIKKFNLDEKIYDIKLIKTIISNAKNKMQDAYAFSTSARDYKTEKIAEIYYEYEKQLSLNNAIDFDDMLLLSCNLIEDNLEVREEYASRFKHILVDEFQDTNKAQYKLVRMLFNDKKALEKDTSLLAVGDVDQSIYSWRGADFKIILGFQKDYQNVKLIKLEQNYRSTNNILNAANVLIQNNEQRIEKNLYSTKGDGEKIKIYEAASDYNESDYIANTIKSLTARGTDVEDIAILYRTNAQSRNIEESLMANSIPYKIVGGLKFYDRAEIKDILAYLKFIYNTSDSASLKRIINVPKRGIGDSTFKKLSEISDEENLSIFEIIKNIDNYEDFTPRIKGLLTTFVNLIEDFIYKQEVYPLSEFVSYILDYSGYIKELQENDKVEDQSRIENLQEFINVVREFEEDDFSSEDEENLTPLGTFLTQVALVSDVDGIKDEEKSVTLMTLHSAKGLEFPVVFLAGLEEGLFPHQRAISYQASSNDLEEERRLMYVGITRAKEELFITYAKQRMFWGDLKSYPKSRFLSEIPIGLIDFEGSEHMEIEPVKRTSSFKKAVHKIKETQKTDSYNDSYNKTSSYGNNLASSLKNIKSQSVSTPATNNLASSVNRIIIKKAQPKNDNVSSNNHSPSNVVKNEENKANSTQSIKDMIAKAKQKASSVKPSVSNSPFGTLPVGTRVFHSHFGIGHIKTVEQEGMYPIYSVEFLKHGIKQIDVSTSELKTF